MRETSLQQDGVLGNRYELDELIGRGGMAEVYRALDRVLARWVAVKLLRSVAASDAERARFADEARTLARLNHPGLVTILDAATSCDRPYLVMELVRGPSLASCCRRGALAPQRVATIGAQLADALGHAHRAGVVHRDLKPSNVLLAAGDRALLTDFGIARLVAATVRHTSTGVRIGTAAYMAPEQVAGQAVTPAADVYALGLVLLEALTGVRAYRGLPVEAALARLSAPPHIPDDVPVAWHGVLRAMTALHPGERPTTSAVAATLRGLAAGVDPEAATATLSRAPAGSGRTVTPAAMAPGAADNRWGLDTGRLDPGSAWSQRVAERWRWLAGATVTAALVALLTASITSSGIDGGGEARTELRNGPPGTATVDGGAAAAGETVDVADVPAGQGSQVSAERAPAEAAQPVEAVEAAQPARDDGAGTAGGDGQGEQSAEHPAAGGAASRSAASAAQGEVAAAQRGAGPPAAQRGAGPPASAEQRAGSGGNGSGRANGKGGLAGT